MSVCFYCTAFLCFNEDLTVRALTQSEQEDLPIELLKELLKARQALLHMYAERKGL